MPTKTFDLATCRACDLLYQPVDWLPQRVAGYCCAKCQPEPKPDEVAADADHVADADQAQPALPF